MSAISSSEQVPAQAPEILTSAQAAEFLCLSSSREFLKLAKQERIPLARLSGRRGYRVRRAVLEGFLKDIERPIR